MAVGNEQTTSRFKRNIKSNSYLVHCRPYQGAKKRKLVASSTRWWLGYNIVLRLMECLTPTVTFGLFVDNYATPFRLFVWLPVLELRTFKQEVCSTKIGYASTLSSVTNSCRKRNVATLNSASHIKQKRCITCVPGYNNSRGLYISSSESCQPNRNFLGVETKLKESTFKSSNQTNSTVTTATWIFSKEWIRMWSDCYPIEKVVVVPVCLNGMCYSSECVGIVLTEIKTMSLCLFWLFEEILSMQFSWNIHRKANYPQAM